MSGALRALGATAYPRCAPAAGEGLTKPRIVCQASGVVVGRQIDGLSMRLPFFDPRRDEVAAVATDLIKRFGLRAHAEASYLAQLSQQRNSRREKVLYKSVAREIEASFLEAQRRRALRQSASDLANLGGPVPGGNNGGPETPGDAIDPDGPVSHICAQKAEGLGGLVAELNRVDVDPSPRRTSSAPRIRLPKVFQRFP
jgi:hypothetical protein